MSVNKYTTASGLQTLANGSRVWIGTKANHAAARQAGTLPTDCLICITDDDDEYKTDQVIEDSQMTITSGGVYDALEWKLLKSQNIANGDTVSFTLPSIYHEVLIITGTPVYRFNDIIPYTEMEAAANYALYHAVGNNDYQAAQFSISNKNSISVSAIRQNGSANTGTINIYYR